MSSDQVIELLREAYGDEIETVMNYQTNAIILLDVGLEALLDLLGANPVEDDGVRLVVHHGLDLVAVGVAQQLDHSIGRHTVLTFASGTEVGSYQLVAHRLLRRRVSSAASGLREQCGGFATAAFSRWPTASRSRSVLVAREMRA
jgi:hypothetical protein